MRYLLVISALVLSGLIVIQFVDEPAPGRPFEDLRIVILTGGKAGESTQLAVSAGALCPWEVTSGSAWITVSASGTGAGSAALLLAANVSAAPRTGTVVVGGIPVDVTQTGAVVRSVAPGGG